MGIGSEKISTDQNIKKPQVVKPLIPSEFSDYEDKNFSDKNRVSDRNGSVKSKNKVS
jgi:hypothetical protein